jgi:two-component system phosphate regulon response regulator PhoB
MFTILVVEDTPVIREPLVRLLQIEGFHTIAAANGKRGDPATRNGKIDLVLLDVLMPRMHGIALLEALARRCAPRRSPVHRADRDRKTRPTSAGCASWGL